MSIDKTRQCVRSKYFVGKTAMDDSLSDFQETKSNCKGPKIIKKVVKTNTRKVTKRIRGQKDIRTALSGKKNELISYSKEFENICKKSGIDVDSEQLQVAIALSKSLQTEVDDASTSQSLPTHRRATKIRATLQEYGFKVPDSKIKTAVTKKIKKHRKQYILLNTTNEERRQKITNKYSQILLETLDYKSHNIASPESSYTPLYSLATNLEYEYMKDNNIFLVDSLRNLVEISVSKGSLLRNWSEIPGRPVSPILFDNTTMDVSEIICSQDELDIILSGPIKSACRIIASKKEQIKDLECDIPKVIVKNKEINTIKEADNKEVDVHEIVTIDVEDYVTKNDDVIKKSVKDITKCNDVIDIVSNTTLPVREQYRSCSPDIFDDEVSYIMETSKPTLSQEHKAKLFTEETNNMDFASCANNIEQVDLMIVNVTKMNPDDLMEMTDCAVTASQAIKVDVKEIDLTQSSDEVSLTEKDCDGVHFLNLITKSLDNTLNQKQVVTNQLDCEDSHKNIDFISVNATKMNPDDFMEMTDCAVTASQAIKVDVKEIDLTQSPDDVHKTEKDGDGIHFSNHITESSDNSLNERHIPHRKCEGNHKNPINDFGLSENSIQQNNKFNKHKSPREESNYPCPAIPSQNSITNINQIVGIGNSEIPSDKIDLTQSFNEEDDKLVTNIEDDITICKETETGNLTQSSKSSVDINDLPEIIVGNTQKDQNNLDDTVILNEEDYIGVNRKFKNPIVTQDDELFDLTQAGDEVLEQPNDFMEGSNSKVQCQSFYEDFVHDHSDKTSEVSNKNSVHNVSNESSDIDLTQSSNGCPEKSDSPKPIDIIPNNSSLGKKDNISIDYDEICEHISDKENIRESDSISIEEDGLSYKKNNSLKSEINEDVEIVDCNDDVSSSQNSEVFDLIDNELDYSLHKSKLHIPTDNYNFEGTLNIDDDFKLESSKKSLAYSVTNKNNTVEETSLPEINLKKIEKRIETEEKRVETEDQLNACSSQDNVHKMNQQSNKALATPCNSEFIIKTDEVTPMLDYASLTTPQRNKELDKYGLKPFKRKRAIQILTHLYNQTHPVIEPYSDDLQPSPSKKPRPESTQSSQTSPNKLKSPEKLNTNSKSRVRNSQSPRKKHKNNINSPRKELNCNRELTSTYEITCNVPNIRSVDCNPDDWVFQKREKSKIHSCRVPLHIAFHNYVSSRGGLREAILKYEPVNIDVIHKDLVSYGHRYDPKDLLRFLDKKCITVKTTDNNARNKR